MWGGWTKIREQWWEVVKRESSFYVETLGDPKWLIPHVTLVEPLQQGSVVEQNIVISTVILSLSITRFLSITLSPSHLSSSLQADFGCKQRWVLQQAIQGGRLLGVQRRYPQWWVGLSLFEKIKIDFFFFFINKYLNLNWIDSPHLRFNFQNKGLGPVSRNLFRAFLSLCHL